MSDSLDPSQEGNPEQVAKIAEAITSVASALHDTWRAGRMADDGTFEPDIEPTTDQDWTKQHGTDQVDIANTTFADLPSDWQAENKGAAHTIVGLIAGASKQIDLDDPAQRNEVGEAIHAAWLARNTAEHGGPLDVPFQKLSFEEQEKDIDQMRLGLSLFGRQDIGESSTSDQQKTVAESDAGISKEEMEDVLDMAHLAVRAQGLIRQDKAAELPPPKEHDQ